MSEKLKNFILASCLVCTVILVCLELINIILLVGIFQSGKELLVGIEDFSNPKMPTLALVQDPTFTQRPTMKSTNTLAPTFSPTPEDTKTATIEPTRQDVNYDFEDKCMQITVYTSPKLIIYECVESITIRSDGKMQVNFMWEVSSDSNEGLAVYPDTGNTNMYLVDNLGNRYDHIETGGDANRTVNLFDGDKKFGWFLFPAADPDAAYFIFHDDDNNKQTDMIFKEWDN